MKIFSYVGFEELQGLSSYLCWGIFNRNWELSQPLYMGDCRLGTMTKHNTLPRWAPYISVTSKVTSDYRCNRLSLHSKFNSVFLHLFSRQYHSFNYCITVNTFKHLQVNPMHKGLRAHSSTQDYPIQRQQFSRVPTYAALSFDQPLHTHQILKKKWKTYETKLVRSPRNNTRASG